jgi:hypothetical protein
MENAGVLRKVKNFSFEMVKIQSLTGRNLFFFITQNIGFTSKNFGLLNWEEFDFGLVKINLPFGLSAHGLRVCQD